MERKKKTESDLDTIIANAEDAVENIDTDFSHAVDEARSTLDQLIEYARELEEENANLKWEALHREDVERIAKLEAVVEAGKKMRRLQGHGDSVRAWDEALRALGGGEREG